MNKTILSDVNKVLLGAIQLLETDGWCQGLSVNGAGEHCIGGAIHHAAWRLKLRPMPAMQRVLDLVPGGVATVWNDNPLRTKEEVINLLLSAISKE